MKTYHNHRAEPYFTFVKEGKKTIEIRIFKAKYKLIKPGDHIIVYNETETDNIEVRVIDVRRYNTFRELLSKENISKVLPDAKSFDDALKKPYKFYTKEQEKECGVVAIEVELV